jgi:hypothetical protein
MANPGNNAKKQRPNGKVLRVRTKTTGGNPNTRLGVLLNFPGQGQILASHLRGR